MNSDNLTDTDTFKLDKARNSAFLDHEREPGRQRSSQEVGVDPILEQESEQKQQESVGALAPS